MPTSLSDYFAQRIAPDPTDPVPVPLTDAQSNAAIDARNATLYRQKEAQSSPLLAGIDQGVSQIGTGLTALHGLGQAALASNPTDQAAAVATLRRAQTQTQQDQDYTPDNAGSLSDAYKTGNLSTYAAYKLGSLLPGTAAAVGAGLATGGAADLAAGVIGGGEDVAAGAAADAVLPTAADAAAAAAGKAVPAAGQDAIEAAAAPAAAPASGINLPHTVGEFLGAGSTGAVQAAPSQVDDVLNDPGDGSTVQDRAQKALAITGVQGAIGAAPTLGLLARYGLSGAASDIAANAVEKAAPGLAQRIGTNAAEQAAIGGGSAAASVYVDRAAHAWITGHPDAAPALPAYINGIADGVLGGAVFGAPAGFKGEHSVSEAIRETTNNLADQLKSRATPEDSAGVKTGDPVNADGSPIAGTAQRQFDDNLSAVQDDPDTHFDNLVKSTAPYSIKDDGTTATLNGPAAGLIDPERMAALKDVFDTPTEQAIGSMVTGSSSPLTGAADDGYLTPEHKEQVVAAAKAFTDGYSSLSNADKNKVADFTQNTLDPDQRQMFTRVLATVDKLSPDVKSRLDFAKANSTNSDGSAFTTPDVRQGDVTTTRFGGEDGTSVEISPGPIEKGQKVATSVAPDSPFAEVEGTDPPGELGYVDDQTYKNAQFYKTKDGPERESPDEENVKLTKGNQAPVDFNLKQAASSVSATPEGRALLSNGGNRKVNAVLAVASDALARGHAIDPDSITAGKRVFPTKKNQPNDGVLTAAEAKAIRDQLRTQAPAERPVDETGGRAAPSKPLDLGGDSTQDEANGDISKTAENEASELGKSNLKQAPNEDRKIANTISKAAEGLGIPTHENGRTRTMSELHAEALTKPDSPFRRVLMSGIRQLSETDKGLEARVEENTDPQTMLENQHRATVSDFTGERIQADKAAQIPYLKKLLEGAKPTPEQVAAYKAIRDRTDNFAGNSDKQEKYAQSLMSKIRDQRTAEKAAPKLDDNVKPADAPLPKTLTEAQAEAKAADDYARNPPEDFTAAKAREMAARMDAISARAKESRDKLGPDHPKYDDMDDVRMNAKDAAEALRNVAKQQEISEQAHPDWFDKNTPASDQKVPSDGKGTIRDAVEKLKELPEFKAITKSIKDLVGTVRTKADTVREGRLVSSLTKAFGTSPLRIEEGTDGTPGSYKDGVITIDKNLKGAARAAVIMHEFGHHLFDEKISSASDEVRSAMQADYQKWAAAQTGKDSFEVRASRAPLFTSLRLFDHLNGRAAESLSGKNADYLVNSNEYFADQIARVLDQHEGVQSFMGKLAQNIKLAYDLARGVDPRLTDTSSAVRDWVHSLYEAPAAPDTHESPATVSGDAPRAGSGTPHDVSATLKPQENKILYDFFSRKDIMKQLLTGADPDMRDALGDVGTRIESAVNEGFKRWVAGDLQLADKTALAPLKNLRDAVMKTVGITTQRELAERVLSDIKENKIDAGYNAKERIEHEKQQDLRDAGKTRQLQVRQAVVAVGHVIESKIEPVNVRLMSSLDQRMRETGVPALQKLVSIVHRQTGETGEGTPLTQQIGQQNAVWLDRILKGIGAKDLSPEDQARVIEGLQTKQPIIDRPDLEERRQAILQPLKDIRGYQVSKGAELGNVEEYFPTVMDTKQVAERGDEFKALLSNPKFVEPMRDYFRAKGFDNADKLTHMDMIDKMHNMAMYKADYSLAGRSYSDTSGGSSGAPQFNLRVSEFMYKHGSPEELKQFASFQSKDLEQILIPYARIAVKNAEFTNALGKTRDMKSSTFEQLLDHARAQGASDEHIQLAKDYVDAAMGSYNPGRSQVMAKVLGSFDNVFGTKLSDVNSVQYKNLSNAIIAYQNLRTLGLGLFGNLIDPLGVWTRSSNLGQTFGAYKEAMKAIAGKGSTYAVDMAHILGTAQSHANGDALAYVYGADTTSDIKSWPARLNRALFKVNGMESITNFARVAATVAANKFLLAHAGDATNAHSARYLKELNLKPEDVMEDPAHPGYVKVTPETQRAIYQFVSESVLRPVPTQKPLWHNDPHFAVAAQYKGYLYSFYNTISARMLHEVRQGNYAGAAPVIGYMAVSMAAELAREFVQYGTAGNPNRQDWDAKNYLELAASRSGLAGPKLDVAADSIEDVRRGNIPGQSITGPSVSQAGDIIKTLAGRESVDGTILSGLPGQSIYKGWVHGDDDDKGNKAERGEGGAESYTGSG